MTFLGVILGYAKRLAASVELADQHSADLQELREQMADVTKRMEQLHAELAQVRLESRLEREKLVLQFENALLRFEKRLPAPKSGRDPK